MKLYVTYTSPYARLARIVVIEKALGDRVKIIEAKTRTTDSPYYQINPSGRVPYLVDDAGVGMEDSQLICAYLDSLDGKPRFHDPRGASNGYKQRVDPDTASRVAGSVPANRHLPIKPSSNPNLVWKAVMIGVEIGTGERLNLRRWGCAAETTAANSLRYRHELQNVVIEILEVNPSSAVPIVELCVIERPRSTSECAPSGFHSM